MSAIFESETLGPTERLIMLALADHADDEGRCYPSIARLCQRTGLGERAVQSNIRKLQDMGHLRIVAGGGRSRPNLYIVVANPAQETPFHSVNPAAETPFENTNPASAALNPAFGALNPAADAPEPSRTIKEPSDKDARDVLSEILRPETVDAFLAHRKAKRAKLTAHAAALIARKLDGHPDPDAVVELSIMQGWTGVFPENAVASRSAQPKSHMSEIFARMRAEHQAKGNLQ